MREVQPIRDPDVIVAIQNYLKVRSFRNYLLFTMGIHCGLRVSDLLNLKAGDVRDQLHINYFAQKTRNRRKRRKERRFIIHPSYYDDLMIYIQNMDDDEYLFASRQRKSTGEKGKPISRQMAWRMISDAAKQFGLKDIGTHSLRKTWGYHLIMNAEPHEMPYVMALLMEAFGHESQEVTLRYLGLTQDMLDRMVLRLSFTKTG
jgi:Site-specific recombinase XerD